MDSAHVCSSSLFVGTETEPELEQSYNIISTQWRAPSTWSALLASSLPSFELAMFDSLHVRMIETCGQVFVSKTEKKTKNRFLFDWKEKNVRFGPLLSAWPTYLESKYEVLWLWNVWPQHRQYKTRLTSSSRSYFCRWSTSLVFFLIIFGIVTFAGRRNFTNFPLSSACCNPRGRLVLLFALSKHVLVREIAQSLQTSTPSHG